MSCWREDITVCRIWGRKCVWFSSSMQCKSNFRFSMIVFCLCVSNTTSLLKNYIHASCSAFLAYFRIYCSCKNYCYCCVEISETCSYRKLWCFYASYHIVKLKKNTVSLLYYQDIISFSWLVFVTNAGPSFTACRLGNHSSDLVNYIIQTYIYERALCWPAITWFTKRKDLLWWLSVYNFSWFFLFLVLYEIDIAMEIMQLVMLLLLLLPNFQSLLYLLL
jgi:hypothetical protein